MDLSRAVWRKTSRSTSNGGNCVEVASVPGTVAIRDSPNLIVTSGDFRRLAEALKHV